MLAAFAAGFLAIGIGIGITIYRAALPWFLSLMSIATLQEVITETSAKYQAKWLRENTRVKRLNWHAAGRHLIGVPLRASAVEEVTKKFEEVKQGKESRRL